MSPKQTSSRLFLALTLWLCGAIWTFGQDSEDPTEQSQDTNALTAEKGDQSEAEPSKRHISRRKAKGAENYFSVKVEQAQQGDDVLLVQVTLARQPQEDQWIGESIVYWVEPKGGGFSIPIRPVTQSVLAAQVYGPFEKGQHKLLVSLAVRGKDRFVKTFYEQEITLEIPTLKLAATPIRRLPTLDGSDGVGYSDNQSGSSGWLTALKWLGFMTVGVFAIALLGLGGLILRRRGILTFRAGHLLDKLAAPFLAKLAAIKARRKPEKASDENAPPDSAAEDRTVITEESGDHPEGATVIETVNPSENPAADLPVESEAAAGDASSSVEDEADSAQQADLQEQTF